jgi:chromosome segregation ATPase
MPDTLPDVEPLIAELQSAAAVSATPRLARATSEACQALRSHADAAVTVRAGQADLIADLNAANAGLRQTVDQLRDDLTTCNAGKLAAEQALADLTADRAKLDARIAEQATEVEHLKASLADALKSAAAPAPAEAPKS